jgi:hypothetical protein
MRVIVFGIIGLGIPLDASSGPEKIRPGHSYYSDELAEPTNQGLVRALGAEKNYEEVYQLYTYYEVVYDEGKRVVLFREYKRGEVIRSEEYRYDDAGSLTLRVVAQPGKEDDVTVVKATGSDDDPR